MARTKQTNASTQGSAASARKTVPLSTKALAINTTDASEQVKKPKRRVNSKKASIRRNTRLVERYSKKTLFPRETFLRKLRAHLEGDKDISITDDAKRDLQDYLEARLRDRVLQASVICMMTNKLKLTTKHFEMRDMSEQLINGIRQTMLAS